MATDTAIALRRVRATERLTKALRALSEYLKVPDLVLPTNSPDPQILRVFVLEGIATWAEAAAEAIGLELPVDIPVADLSGPTPVVAQPNAEPVAPEMNFNELTIKELLAYATEHEIVLDHEVSRKADIIEAIKAARK